ncbi:MAG: hypothetical protein M3384_17715 [Acidobacteriota bacterium]|nr:hypothetical protein [Acidobacteriota bacterium]
MPANEQDVLNLIKSGNVELSQLEQMFSSSTESDSLSGVVSISGWEVVYSSSTGQLSQYATITANGGSITGLGMLTYSGNGSKMWCLQYNNGYSASQINASVGTTLYTPSMGNQALCVIYGSTTGGSFYYPSTMNIISS